MPNYLLVHSGVYVGTDEIFVHTLSVNSPETDAGAVAVDAAAAINDTWEASAATLATQFADAVSYTDVSAAEILDLANGDLAAAQHVPITAAFMEGTGPAGAYQLSPVVSLIAGTRPNGTPLRGRFYLPTPAGTSYTDLGRFTTTFTDRVAAWVGAWFDALVAAQMTPSVWSRVLATLQPVTTADVGDVPDVMTSRRNKINEQRTDAWPTV